MCEVCKLNIFKKLKKKTLNINLFKIRSIQYNLTNTNRGYIEDILLIIDKLFLNNIQGYIHFLTDHNYRLLCLHLFCLLQYMIISQKYATCLMNIVLTMYI